MVTMWGEERRERQGQRLLLAEAERHTYYDPGSPGHWHLLTYSYWQLSVVAVEINGTPLMHNLIGKGGI